MLITLMKIGFESELGSSTMLGGSADDAPARAIWEMSVEANTTREVSDRKVTPMKTISTPVFAASAFWVLICSPRVFANDLEAVGLQLVPEGAGMYHANLSVGLTISTGIPRIDYEIKIDGTTIISGGPDVIKSVPCPIAKPCSAGCAITIFPNKPWGRSFGGACIYFSSFNECFVNF